MKVQNYLIALLLFSLVPQVADAQDYKSGIGLKLGSPWMSGTYKVNLNERAGLEAFLGFQSFGVGIFGYSYLTFGGLYQYHFPIEAIPGLRWYVGGGAIASLYTYDSGWVLPDDRDSRFSFGPAGVGGAEYTFSNIPLTVFVDVIPNILFGGGYRDGFIIYGSAGARYILSR